MFCDTFYPLQADIYYGVESQNDFGEIDRAWEYNRTIRLDMNMSTNYKDQQVQPDQFFWIQDMLNGITPTDIRQSDTSDLYSLTNILITNILNGSNVVDGGGGTTLQLAPPAPCPRQCPQQSRILHPVSG